MSVPLWALAVLIAGAGAAVVDVTVVAPREKSPTPMVPAPTGACVDDGAAKENLFAPMVPAEEVAALVVFVVEVVAVPPPKENSLAPIAPPEVLVVLVVAVVAVVVVVVVCVEEVVRNTQASGTLLFRARVNRTVVQPVPYGPSIKISIVYQF